MSLYDVMDGMTERNVTKSVTGDNRMFGVAVGRVTKNYNKDAPGRVCVEILDRDHEANELLWVRVAMPYAGKKSGSYSMPEVGDLVIIIFLDGNFDSPIVYAAVFPDGSSTVSRYADEDNQYKVLIDSFHGNRIVVEDNKEGDGDKDKVTIETAKKKHLFLMDNENMKVVMQDQNGKNRYEMRTEDGRTEIVAEKELVILVGDDISMKMGNGRITVKAKEVVFETSGQMKLQSNGTLSGKGAQVMMEGDSMVKLESSGILKIAGTPVKVG
ncbi:MAG: hypothetical protein KHZ58_06750 [Hungatella hathewayi]|nr:hypothetical protein [Hungatella hathewayi]